MALMQHFFFVYLRSCKPFKVAPSEMKIIVNNPFQSTWARQDEELISKIFPSKVQFFNGFRGSIVVGFWKCLKLIWKHRSEEVIWLHQSAGYLSILPCSVGKWLGQKNIIIAVGTESACFPEISYGHYRKEPLRTLTILSMRGADLICPVHELMELYDYSYWDVRYKQQGIKAFAPRLTTPFMAIHNGYSQEDWGVDKPWKDRPIDVICAFTAGAKNRSILKGADLIIRVAERNSDLRFRIIGKADPTFKPTKNLEFVGNCTQQELRQHYNDAKVFIQASITEGFPNTLCESMACGCFPIGSRVAAIPDIIDIHGLLLDRRNDELLEQKLKEALLIIQSGTLDQLAISDSIFQRFNQEKRAAGVERAIQFVRSR